MRDVDEVADLIILKFITNNGAQGSRNFFASLGKTENGVRVCRMNGSVYEVSKEHVIRAIEAVRSEPAIYGAGPSRLKPYIKRWIYSPLWAMLHLLSLNEITT